MIYKKKIWVPKSVLTGLNRCCFSPSWLCMSFINKYTTIMRWNKKGTKNSKTLLLDRKLYTWILKLLFKACTLNSKLFY